MKIPEICLFIRRNLIVATIGLPFGSSERWISCHHYEQNNSKRENVDTLTVIWPLFVDFWSHVVAGSHVGIQLTSTVFSLNESGESEVGNFNVKLGAEEGVIWLKVSVGDALLVNVVDTFDHLTEVVSCQPFSKSSGLY